MKKFLELKFKSKAIVIDARSVNVVAPDGEVFELCCTLGMNSNEFSRNYFLHVLEYVFDKNYSKDKELMVNNIWRDSMVNGLNVLGIGSGNRQGERSRIGNRIRQIREERGMEARDLAKLASIDAANLSRIENGKYSVGLDILSKIAASLGKKIDLVDL